MHRILVAVVLVVAAVLRFWGLQFGLPNDLARPDEEKIIHAALVVVGGDPNPHFFLYPSLFIYLAAAAYTLVFALGATSVSAASYAAHAVADPSLLHLVPRTLSAAAGVATVAVVYAAARELFSTRVSLAASAFLAVAYLHVRDAHFGTTDVPVALACMCAFWAAARCAGRGATVSRAAVMGLLCGLAASTKYNAVLVAAPAGLAILADALESRRWPTQRELALLLLCGACAGLAFVLTTPFAVLDRAGFIAQFSEQRRIFAGIQNGSIIGPARSVLGGARGWSYYPTFTLPHGLGWPLFLASLAGAAWLFVERWRRALLVLAFPAVYYASMGMGQLLYARNMVPILPFLCLAAGAFVGGAATRIERRFRNRPAAAFCGATLVAALAAPTAAEAIRFDRIASLTDTRVQAARWLDTHVPAGMSVYQTGIFYGHVQPVPADRYRTASFDERRDRFVVGGDPTRLPDAVVRLDSPLVVYSRVPDALLPLLESRYVLTRVFAARARGAALEGIYDQQDAWYLPFANLAAVVRPGPDVYIYLRRD
ncbi:MAG TPA: glycosyltransferase family 39 protein [Vicinamibacterales bacterium]|jgi:hypothetical protein